MYAVTISHGPHNRLTRLQPLVEIVPTIVEYQSLAALTCPCRSMQMLQASTQKSFASTILK